jgi:hypothetical protein
MIRLVLSDVKVEVEKSEITIAHANAGHQRLSKDTYSNR